MPPTPRDPDCQWCPHRTHLLPCDLCDCKTNHVGAAWNHDYDQKGN